jgi:Ca2+-binding EF-hand superfamily protein
MLSELQIKNVGTVFDVLDHDHDGFIDRADFEGVASQVGDGLRLSADSANLQGILDAYVGWWEQIRGEADSDGDGRVTRDEFIAAVERGLLGDPAYLDAVSVAVDADFTAADQDGDGYLVLEELAAIYGSVGVGSEVAVAAFEQMDVDGDGRVSRDEFRAAVQGLFTSVGPESYGSNALGNA